jgi:hypothetical protein
LHGSGKTTCAAMLIVICGFTAGCADTASSAPHSLAHVATANSNSKRFCAYQISAATASENAAINHYWTPLARSAIKFVSQGKMSVPVPKQHLTGSQRRALRRAEWAERAFSPKPRLICAQLPSGHIVPNGAGPVAPK